MRILITAGPTHEPIDPVRFIGNRSSGRMGAALAAAALAMGHSVTLILGPISGLGPPAGVRRVDFESSVQLQEAVNREFPGNDLLIMAAAVADFRPLHVSDRKLPRAQRMELVLEATADIAQAAARSRRADQRVVGFSLETGGDLERAAAKLLAKHLDMIVCNSPETIGSDTIAPTLLYPDRPNETIKSMTKIEFAELLLRRSIALFARPLPG